MLPAMGGKRGSFHKNVLIPSSIRSRFGAVKWDESTKQDILDDFVVKWFPTFIVLCLFFAIGLGVLFNSDSFADFLYTVCLAFSLGFSVFGLVALVMSDDGIIDSGHKVYILLALPGMLATALCLMGPEFFINTYIIDFYDVFHGGATDILGIFIGVYSLFTMIILVGFGVVSVIVGYFRSYLHRILAYIEKSKDADTLRKRITYGMFMIPDIIDVKSVELDPEDDGTRFNRDLMLGTFTSLFVLGITVCSYLFLNPLFLQNIPFEEMVTISIMLSLFLSPFIIPWSIIKSVGANVTSDAPRPYFLWKGLKGRLYQSFFAVAFMMMMITLSAYLGMDFSRILWTYVGYVAIMGVISLITSFIYVNYFYRGFRNGIIKSFYQHKYGVGGKD